MVVSSIYWTNLISFLAEYHHVIQYFIRWVDEFPMPGTVENLLDFRGFMTDFNRYPMGMSEVPNR